MDILDADGFESALRSLVSLGADNQRSIEQAIEAANIATTERDLAEFRLERDFPFAVRDLTANAGARGLSRSGFLAQALRRANDSRQDALTDLDLGLLKQLSGLAGQANVSNAGLFALSADLERALG